MGFKDEQFLVIPEEKKKEEILDSENFGNEKNKNEEKKESAEKKQESSVEGAEKSEFEKIRDKFLELERGIDSMKGTLKYLELREKNSQNEETIRILKEKIEEAEKEKKPIETEYRIASLEKRVSELEKLLSEKNTKELGLSEKEAKEASDEMKNEIKEISTEKLSDAKDEKKEILVEIKNSPVEISPELSRMNKNIEELEKDIEATKKGLSSSPVDIRMKIATLNELKKERDAITINDSISANLSVFESSSYASETKLKEQKSESTIKSDSSLENKTETKSDLSDKNKTSTEESFLEKKKDVIPSAASGVFKETYEKHIEKQKGKSKWGFWKERLKGFFTLGGLEIYQAERFRKRTNESSEDISLDAKRIQQTKVLDLNSALVEAEKIKELAEKEGKFGDISKDEIEKYSQFVTETKENENSIIINTIINKSTENLERQLARYKDEYGDSAVAVEKLDAFRKRLRTELESLQRGFLFKEELEGAGELAKSRPSRIREAILANPDAFKKTIRESLDPKYWKRYVYASFIGSFFKKLRDK